MALTSPQKAAEREADSVLSWEEHAPRTPENRFRIYSLRDCPACNRARYVDGVKCPECRGEGVVRQLLATAATPEAAGVAIVELGRDKEFEDQPLGLLDTMGEKGQKWLVRMWQASPRNTSDAGRVLSTAAHKSTTKRARVHP